MPRVLLFLASNSRTEARFRAVRILRSVGPLQETSLGGSASACATARCGRGEDAVGDDRCDRAVDRLR